MMRKDLNNMSVCPLCNGAGEKDFVETHPYTKLKRVVTQWCLCKKSEQVSAENPMLGWLSKNYLPLEDVDEQLLFLPKDLKSPNLLILNTDYQSFCLHMKSVLIKYRFIDEVSVKLCKAFNLLKDYYVEQPDGSKPSLHDLNNFDLLIFSLDTKQKNDQLNTCVSEVVHNRLCACKPTWIYLPKGVPFDNTRESSDELKAMIRPNSDSVDGFKKIELKEQVFNGETVKTNVQRKAEGFRL